MKLIPFNKMLAMSKEKMDEALAPARARQVKATAELEMSKLETEILTKETKVQEMFTSKEVNFPKLMDALDEIALLERRQQQYLDVLGQLFPEKK